MSIFNRHSGKDDDPWEMMAHQDVDGYCPNCKRKETATKSSFRNGTIEYRCHHCKKIVSFEEAGSNTNNPYAYPPSRDDEDEGPKHGGSGRYTKGRR